MSARGLLVAAAASGIGKTTVTLGLARALARRGEKVRLVKNGPDYLDGTLHAAAVGRPSLNLDTYAMGDALLRSIADEASRDCDLLIAEGAMGLHDGVRTPDGIRGSSADLAATFGWPVILVLDVSGQTTSAAAVARGLSGFDERIEIAGVILNRVASTRHLELLRKAFEAAGIVVFGALRRDDNVALPSRHLGLVRAEEVADLEGRLDRLADIVEREIDVDEVVAAAGARPRSASGDMSSGLALPPPGQRIALAQDHAFSFVYPHLVEGWRRAGAAILSFSPLSDEAPAAEADCCWLPGGYPELHAGRLAAARHFLDGIVRFGETRPVHGECGGYMVLGETLEDGEGATHRMAGCLPVQTSFARRRLHLGYRVARVTSDCGLAPAGSVVVGHEFHYATARSEEGLEPNCVKLTSVEGRDLGAAGHRRGLVSGTFFHAIAMR